MSISSAIKSIQDIMRKDAGVDGDAQRLGQLSWLLFLKIFDAQEEELEDEQDNYRQPIPEKYFWREWAADDQGITGDALLEFINGDLIPGLKELAAPIKSNPRGYVAKEAFSDAFNYMKNGTLLRQVINKLNEIDFTIYVIVVDKKEIDSEGLSIKQSFYKYFNKLLVTDLNRINNKITFIADQIGTAEYQKSFQKYIESEVTQYDLFNETKLFEFSDSKENNLVQLSDFIVGSLAKCFDTKHFQENSSEYLTLLKDKLNVRFWPNNVAK